MLTTLLIVIVAFAQGFVIGALVQDRRITRELKRIRAGLEDRS